MANRQPRRRRIGCLLAGLGLVAAWALCGWALWLAALNAPMPETDEKPPPFEFIPSPEGN